MDIALPIITQEELMVLSGRANSVIERLRERIFSPGTQKQLDIQFNVKTAATMVGRSEKAIRDAETDGRLPEAPKNPATGRRNGYSLNDVNRMRKLFGTLPHRSADDPPAVIAVQNFKGGVGKSTTVTHLSHYFALKGYRVCIIDCDSQASTTALFGLNPDVDVNEDEDTIYPFLQHGGPKSLHYALRATSWPGVAIIPANLGLYDAEYEFAARMAREPAFILDRLREGVETISDQFDIILLDPPPALGMLSLSVLRAANALLIPTPPNNIDFASTAHFLKMMESTLAELAKAGGERHYSFVKILTSKMNDQKSAHQAIKRMMDAVFSQDMLQAVLKDSAEIDNATANLMSVYEMTGPAVRTETHKRCRAYLDAVGREVEILIRKTWPSHFSDLRKEGLL